MLLQVKIPDGASTMADLKNFLTLVPFTGNHGKGQINAWNQLRHAATAL